jgi:hypothetical protein
MKTATITKEDILSVAKDLRIPVNEEEIQFILDNYEDAQKDDPTGTWNLVVEQMLYDVTEPRNHEFVECMKCDWYGIDSQLNDGRCPACGDIIRYPTNMTKAEAIEAMKNGRKVRHTYFSSDEWASMDMGLIVLEDGVTCEPDEFWKWRKAPMFDNGWSIVNS